MKKYILFSIIFLLSCVNADESLYKKAEKLEINGQYKEAMILYKKTARKEQKINNLFIDEDKKKELVIDCKVLNTIKDKSTVKKLSKYFLHHLTYTRMKKTIYYHFPMTVRKKRTENKLKQNSKLV